VIRSRRFDSAQVYYNLLNPSAGRSMPKAWTGQNLGGIIEACRENRVAVLLSGVLSPGGYLLVLFAFRLSKAGYVVAGREVSIVISALIGSLLLKEGALGRRLAGAAVVASGVVCVALAR